MRLLLLFLLLLFSEGIQSRYCFPESERHTRAAEVVPPPKILLNERDWTSHKRLTQVVAILVHEKLGREVEIIRFHDSGMDESYRAVADGRVDFDVEMWPASSIHGGREYAMDINANRPFRNLGVLGATGRSGWFLKREEVLQARQRSGTASWQWQSLAALVGIDAFNTSSFNPTRLMGIDGQTTDPAWAFSAVKPGAPCCTAAEAAAGTCAPGARKCVMLAVSSPIWDPGENEVPVPLKK